MKRAFLVLLVMIGLVGWQVYRLQRKVELHRQASILMAQGGLATVVAMLDIESRIAQLEALRNDSVATAEPISFQSGLWRISSSTCKELPPSVMDDLMYSPTTQCSDTFTIRTVDDGRVLSCIAIWNIVRGDTSEYAQVYVKVRDLQ